MYDVNVNREAAFTTYSYRLKYPIGDTQFWIEKIKHHEAEMREFTENKNLNSFGVATNNNLLNEYNFHELL